MAISYYRGLAVHSSSNDGAMIAVAQSEGEAEEYIRKLNLNGQINVACVNSSISVTISGNAQAIDVLSSNLDSDKIWAKELKTSGKAYHSHHMESVSEGYRTLLDAIPLDLQTCTTKDTGIDMLSSVNYKQVTSKQVQTATYWITNLKSPVQFNAAFRELMAKGPYHVVEIGPHPALEIPIKTIGKDLGLGSDKLAFFPTLKRGKDSVVSLLHCVGDLYLEGHEIDFDKFYELGDSVANGKAIKRRVISDLPSYPWQYGALLWHESRLSSEFRTRQYPPHELLGSRILGQTTNVLIWRNLLQLKHVSWIRDHCLGDSILVPGATWTAMSVEAIRQAENLDFSGSMSIRLRGLEFTKALALVDDGSEVEVFTYLWHFSDSDARWEFEMASCRDNVTTIHAKGSIQSFREDRSLDRISDLPTTSQKEQSTEKWYDQWAAEGLNYGPTFQSMKALVMDCNTNTRHARSKAARIPRVKPSFEASKYVIHPVTLDAALQTAIISNTSGHLNNLRAEVATSIGEIVITSKRYAEEEELCMVRAVSKTAGFGLAQASAEIESTNGSLLVQLKDISLLTVNDTGNLSNESNRYPLLRISWKPDLELAAKQGKFEECLRYSERLVGGPHGPDRISTQVSAFLDLLTHRQPHLQILEIVKGNNSLSEELPIFLNADISFKRFKNYTQAYFDDKDQILGRDFEIDDEKEAAELPKKGNYDLIVCSSVSCNQTKIREADW